jgi:hypothetical protein
VQNVHSLSASGDRRISPASFAVLGEQIGQNLRRQVVHGAIELDRQSL